MDEDLKKNVLKTGTSIVGIVCKDGVVVGADRKVTAGNITVQKNMRKVSKVTNYLIGAVCGNASDAQMLFRVVKAELKLKELRSKQRPTIKASASLVSMMSYRNIRNPTMIPNIVGSLIAGVNEDGTVELYSIEPAGGIYQVEDFDANFGSGMPFILGLLERQYKKDITVKQGAELAVEALKSSTQRDTASGFGIDVYAITKDGIKLIIAQDINPDYQSSK